jgi:hypothetical protein
LTLGDGTRGADCGGFRQPLGYAIVNELIISQVPTLYTTPVVVLYLDRLSPWLTGASYTRTRIPNPAGTFTRPRVA